MEIDFPIIIIGVILLLAFVVPVIWFTRSGSKTKNLLNKEYQNMITDHNLHIDETDEWRNRIIGIDKTSGKLVFAFLNDKEMQTFLISTKKIQQVKLVKSDNDDITLTLYMQDGKSRDLSFYNTSRDYISEERAVQALAQKWNNILLRLREISFVKS